MSLRGESLTGKEYLMGDPIRLFCCDLNWTRYDDKYAPPSMPQDWAFIDPQEYADWHLHFGNNALFCQAFTFCGYAFYPTRLGPVAPGPGRDLLPSLFALARKRGVPFWSYFSVSWDLIVRGLRSEWTFPGNPSGWCLAPETPWTDLLCGRVREFLSAYPVDWILFDMFLYGDVRTNAFAVQPAWFVEKPFREIIGRPMPDKAEDITPEESMAYKREIMARQFARLRDAVKQTSPQTRILFNVPYWSADEPLWANHPMMTQSDGLFAECTTPEVVEWLLRVRRPHQRVMTTIIGHAHYSDPTLWRRWYEEGCDFFGYAFGTPPDFRPHSFYRDKLEITRQAFQEMQANAPR
jgi:hypothetical protein